ncbi:MAG: TerB family tellurite resistance protein [Myxococcota bacterium]|nr:TerB family tellurite resistance protein [Myxococcota bacterium]
MDFKALTNDERLALAALTRTMVRLDRSYSADESDRLRAIAAELGDPEAFWETMELAEQTVDSPEKLRVVTGSVTRPEARALILDVLSSLAAADAGSEAELKMIDEVRALWDGDTSGPYRA